VAVVSGADAAVTAVVVAVIAFDAAAFVWWLVDDRRHRRARRERHDRYVTRTSLAGLLASENDAGRLTELADEAMRDADAFDRDRAWHAADSARHQASTLYRLAGDQAAER
jgi:hypothetical protein